MNPFFSLIEPFTTINSASHLFNFQYSDQTIFLRQTSRVDHHTRPKLHNSQPDPPQIRPPNPSTTPDHPQTRQPSDHQIRPILPHQTTRTDHPNRQPSLTTEFQISTAQPVSWNGTGQVHSLWVGSRGVYRALDEPCKAYFPHTFGLKFPDFLSALFNCRQISQRGSLGW